MSREAIDRILRTPSVLEMTGYGRTSLYGHIAAGTFTKPVSLGGRSVGFPLSEVSAVLSARIAGKTDDEIRELVNTLHERRKAVA